MNRKKELLCHYADYNYRLIKYLFPMLTEEIDIKKIKENINEEEKIKKEKESIDNIFKDKICEYLNAKFDIAKLNLQFIDSEHEIFEYDYELSDKILWFINYKCTKVEKDYPELVDDFTIEDAKNILKDFYSDLFKENPNDKNLINYIIDNKINVVYEDDRAVTDVSTKDINITYRSDLLFLIVLAHETAHSYAYSKKNDLMGNTDIRTIEIESSFMEKLFIKHLIEKEYPIIRDDNGIRSVNNDDYETYFLSIFYSILTYAFRIVDEKDFVDTLSKDFEISRDNFNDYLSYSPYNYNYIIQANFIDEVLNDYIPEDYKKMNLRELKENYNYVGLYNHNEFGSFKFANRYVYSYLMSIFFNDICDEKKNKDYFLEILNNKNDYSARDVCDLFGIDIEDTITLPSILMLKYIDIVRKNGADVRIHPYITEDYINREKEYYDKMIKDNKNSNGLEQEKMILLRKLFHLYNKTRLDSNNYPFDINSQLDDYEVDEVDKINKRLKKIL